MMPRARENLIVPQTLEKAGRPGRILLAVSSLSSAGGAERVISEMANWWAARGRDVGVLTLECKDPDHYHLHPGVKRVTIDWQLPRTRLHIPWQFAKHQVMLRNAALDFQPDVLISFIDTTNVRMLFALAGARMPRIVSERVDPRYYDIGPFWSLARRLLYPTSRTLVVQTRAVTAWARGVMPENRVRVIPNFVRAMPGPEGLTVDTAGIEPFILSIGRLELQKGHDLLIRAFARAGAKERGMRLVILGEGPQRANLERLSSDLGVGDAVFLPGIVKEPAGWLYKAKFFVLASRFEGFPNALLEAMACGRAVVSADCPSGPADIIRHDENGLLVPMEDVPSLASAMSRLMEDEPFRDRLARQALEVCSRFSREAVMAHWDDLIESVCVSPR